MGFDMRKARPDLVADMLLYPSDRGGKTQVVVSGWGCPCKLTMDDDEPAWDGWPLLGDTMLEPGQGGRFGWMFLSGAEAADRMKAAGRFYLWEGRIIGEAVVVPDGILASVG